MLLQTRRSSAVVVLVLSFLTAGCGGGVAKKVKLEQHTEGVVAVAFSRDGKLLASASRDNTIKIWDMPGGQMRISIPARATGIAFSPDGTQLAAACLSNVQVFDATTGAGKAEWKLDFFLPEDIPWNAECVAFSPDGKLLATGGGNWVDEMGNGNGIAVWDATQPGAPPKFKLVGGAVSLAFSPDSTLLAAASGKMTTHDGKSEGYVRLYDMATGAPMAAWNTGSTAEHTGGRTTSVAFSADGKMLASCSSDTEALVEGKPATVDNRSDIKLWEVPTGKSIATISPALKQCTGVAFRPDGKTLLVSGGNPFITMKDGAVLEVDVATGETSKVLDAPYLVECLALGPDGKAIAWGCSDLDKGGPTVAQIVHRAEGRPGPPPQDPHAGEKQMDFQVWWTD
jgi:WD40 repeat protein